MNLNQDDDFLVEGDMLTSSIIKSNGSAENVEMSVDAKHGKSRAELVAATSSDQTSSALSFAGKIQNSSKQEIWWQIQSRHVVAYILHLIVTYWLQNENT